MTISGEGMGVITDMVPMGIPTNKTYCLYEKGRINLPEKDIKYRRWAKWESLEKRCNDDSHTLIPHIEERVERHYKNNTT